MAECKNRSGLFYDKNRFFCSFLLCSFQKAKEDRSLFLSKKKSLFFIPFFFVKKCLFLCFFGKKRNRRIPFFLLFFFVKFRFSCFFYRFLFWSAFFWIILCFVQIFNQNSSFFKKNSCPQKDRNQRTDCFTLFAPSSPPDR